MAGASNDEQIKGVSMAAKTDKTSVATNNTTRTLHVTYDGKQTRESYTAELALSPIVINGSTASMFAKGTFGEIDLTAAVAVLRERVDQVVSGDLSVAEATLTAQATALDAIFNELARCAALNMGKHLNATETYLRLALKAQSQCRATLETLAEVKYPKSATFVRQQNVAYQQQVNNGGSEKDGGIKQTPTRTENPQSTPNKLLEGVNDERTQMDTETTTAAGRSYQTVGAVDEVDRADKRRGQG